MQTPTREQQQRARIFGVLFALTFVTAIAGLLLYDPVLNDADYILGDGADTRVQLGALCEVILAITNIGTAVVLWPIVKGFKPSPILDDSRYTGVDKGSASPPLTAQQ